MHDMARSIVSLPLMGCLFITVHSGAFCEVSPTGFACLVVHLGGESQFKGELFVQNTTCKQQLGLGPRPLDAASDALISEVRMLLFMQHACTKTTAHT